MHPNSRRQELKLNQLEPELVPVEESEPEPEVKVPTEKVSDTIKNFIESVLSKIEEHEPVAIEEPVPVVKENEE